MAFSAEQLEQLGRLISQNIAFVQRSGLETVSLGAGHVKLRMPLAANTNHIGSMYAGALFTLAEIPGGALFLTSFDTQRYYPIVKEMSIRFRRPARTDVTVEVSISAEEVSRIQQQAEEYGKADYGWVCELRDESGEVVAISNNSYQLRRLGI